MSNHIPLERVSWGVYCPFPGIRAYAEFSFAERQWKTGARYPKLRGRAYTAKRYDVSMEVMTLDLGTDDYLILRHADHKDGVEGKVVMSYPHLRRFVEGLHTALDVARDGCFEEKDGEFILTAKGAGEDSLVIIEDMHGGASVALQPVIVQRGRPNDDEGEDGTEQLGGEPGMRLYLNGWEVYGDVGLDDYATFVEFYDRFDLFATSRTAVQVAVTQLGGVPGVTATKTAAPQPVRKAAAMGLGQRKR
jgi:hypothetical protein